MDFSPTTPAYGQATAGGDLTAQQAEGSAVKHDRTPPSGEPIAGDDDSIIKTDRVGASEAAEEAAGLPAYSIVVERDDGMFELGLYPDAAGPFESRAFAAAVAAKERDRADA
jgi:hypothetical protein